MSKTIKLDDFESLQRYYLSTKTMVTELEVKVTNERHFVFERENLKLSIFSLETGDFLIKMTSGFMTDYPEQDVYVVHKPSDFTEGNRQDIVNNGGQWIFKEPDIEQTAGFELDELEYDNLIINDEVVHSKVFPTLYGVEIYLDLISRLRTDVILNLWGSDDPQANEKYIFALEVGGLISLYEGYLVC